LSALQAERVVLVAKAIFLLRNYLRKNFAAVLPCVINRMTNIKVWEERKPYLAVGDKLQTEQKW
jgi:hypothetical protein